MPTIETTWCPTCARAVPVNASHWCNILGPFGLRAFPLVTIDLRAV